MSGFIWQNFGFLSRFLNLLRIQQYIRRVSLQQPAQSALIVNKREPSYVPTISADKCKTGRRWFENQVGTVCVSLSTAEEICRLHKYWIRRLCFPPFDPSAVDRVQCLQNSRAVQIVGAARAGRPVVTRAANRAPHCSQHQWRSSRKYVKSGD